MDTPTPRGNVPLTHAERVQRITDLIAEGKTNKQIAQDLRVTRSRIDHIVRTRHLREGQQFAQNLLTKAERGEPTSHSEKRCTGPCGRILPSTPEFFHRNGVKGLYTQCKECKSQKDRAYNRTHREKKTLKERLLDKVQYAESGCWIWTGCTVRGYGQIKMGENKKKVYAHRASYLIFKGPIPDTLVIDHLCRNPLCINPDHLEPVTNKENIMRGEAPTVQLHRAKRCKNGHEVNSVNTRFYTGTERVRCCRVCKRERDRARRAR